MIHRFRMHKWAIIIGIAAIAGMFMFYFFYTQYYRTGYQVQLGNYQLGVTTDEEVIQNEYNALIAKIQADQTHLEYVVQPEPQFAKVRTWFINDERDEIVKRMASLIQDDVNAWQIAVDGEVVGVVAHEDSIKQVLDRVKATYTSDEDKSPTFQEKVTWSAVQTTPVHIEDPSDVEAKLLALKSPAKIHTTEEGDTLWDIANQHQLTLDELLERNPSLGDRIQPGESVLLSPEVHRLNVLSEMTTEEQTSIPYSIETREASTGAKPRDGSEGIKQVTYLLEKVNGQVIDRIALSETIVKQPISQIEVKKPIAQVKASNVSLKAIQTKVKSLSTSNRKSEFSWPTDGGIITSPFAVRNGKMHKGIDIAGTASLDIYASAPGKVVFSGTKGDYGNLIIIEHENGYTTYYAHIKKSLVSVGDRVTAGQTIGVMGRTGNATGVSLHFEVRKEGQAYNPLNYVSQ